MFYKDQKKQNDIQYPNLDDKHQRQYNQKEEDTFKNRSNQHFQPRASVFLKKDQAEEEPGCCAKCCKCANLAYYKDFFKVTNKDVLRRSVCNLKFWSGDFFTPKEQDYDLYGPFWLVTTLVFVVGAVHNILQYLGSTNFDYDFQIIGVAFTVLYILGFGFPILFSFLLGCSGVQNRAIQIVCLYGYAHTIYIICCLLCIINIPLLTWGLLLYAAGSKIGFILRNLYEGLEIPTAAKILVLAVVILEAVVQFFIIKLVFIKNVGDTTLTTTSHDLFSNNFMHLRFYGNS